MEKGKRVVRTLCAGCHCSCGVLAQVVDGRVIKVEGDPDNPGNEGTLCPKGLSATQLLYHPDRNMYPKKRVGKRGEGKWQRIPWDEALDYTAAKFNEVIAKHGPSAVTWSWGDGSGRYTTWWSKQAWLYAMGSATHWHSDAHYCYHPVMIANRVTFGDFSTSEIGLDYRNSKCIVLWGGNPVMSHPTRARDIMIGIKNGAKLIVIDPRFTQIASKADLYLQIRPATDDALALGMLNIIINEELYDKDFVEKWCIGFEDLRQRVQEYPVSRVAEITGLKPEDIVKAARMYATNRPSICHTRMGIQMRTNCVQGARAISLLVAICGNLDVKGGHVANTAPEGFKSMHYILESRDDLRQPRELEETRIGAREFPLICGPDSLCLNISHPPSVVHAMLTGKPYPVRANWFLNDIMVCLEGQRENYEAIMSLDFTVGSDYFMTPTMELCDVVLPPTTWLERDGMEDWFGNTGERNYIAARQKVIEPIGDTRDDWWMDIEIIKRMGLKVPHEWNTLDDFYNYQLAGTGVTFKELKERGWLEGKVEFKKYEKNGFNTPSGKVELRSSVLEKYGYDPLPYHNENKYTPVSAPELLKDYPLNLISGHRHISFFHSSNRQIPWLRELEPMPYLDINPETAQKLGMKEGDWAWIKTPNNNERVKMPIRMTQAVNPGVVACMSHWWFPEVKTPDHGVWQSSINLVMSNDPPYDPVSGATTVRGVLANVSKVEESK